MSDVLPFNFYVLFLSKFKFIFDFYNNMILCFFFFKFLDFDFFYLINILLSSFSFFYYLIFVICIFSTPFLYILLLFIEFLLILDDIFFLSTLTLYYNALQHELLYLRRSSTSLSLDTSYN